MFRFTAVVLGLCAIGAQGFSVAPRAAGRRTALRMSEKTTEDVTETEIEWKGAQAVSALTKGVETVFPLEKIAEVLPHRYPFALVDKVIEFEAGKRAVGIKQVTNNEPQFTGHFPERPIMPGVLMIEAMAQLGGVIALQEPVSNGEGTFFFGGVEGVKFRKPVVPGDTLVMEMELTSWKESFGICKMKGTAFVDGKPAVVVQEFTFALVKEDK
uniref:3-hydroxyacyl-[acyl-carrier-protein] dehydratase n=1 Tax=Phaeomonas parva TaxID=124430 RepID=A0A7S1XUS2_9STRA|mmetsp:Transcript_36280/g.113785  ORF Transcript_36280/g.113785 Transcript_36280/m.113785 type:complete len:213 (+) Transcript_36280:153-791(+)|eukprot:CAMPEP_0118885098 /NCGR_PEP_ID=MMETSP1163-20130328/23709_1 /TAXON_ID=124430 /ORGANISM="Phaeomonas parva, Strain CCMP2877" /LENGTH=212 /DNA_ID=CAMNT_0006823047 /DNA_START=28 /DNA_END=666 /DNA_ORIENTATION=+